MLTIQGFSHRRVAKDAATSTPSLRFAFPLLLALTLAAATPALARPHEDPRERLQHARELQVAAYQLLQDAEGNARFNDADEERAIASLRMVEQKAREFRQLVRSGSADSAREDAAFRNVVQAWEASRGSRRDLPVFAEREEDLRRVELALEALSHGYRRDPSAEVATLPAFRIRALAERLFDSTHELARNSGRGRRRYSPRENDAILRVREQARHAAEFRDEIVDRSPAIQRQREMFAPVANAWREVEATASDLPHYPERDEDLARVERVARELMTALRYAPPAPTPVAPRHPTLAKGTRLVAEFNRGMCASDMPVDSPRDVRMYLAEDTRAGDKLLAKGTMLGVGVFRVPAGDGGGRGGLRMVLRGVSDSARDWWTSTSQPVVIRAEGRGVTIEGQGAGPLNATWSRREGICFKPGTRIAFTLAEPLAFDPRDANTP